MGCSLGAAAMSGELCVHGARVSAAAGPDGEGHDALVVLLVPGAAPPPPPLQGALDDALRLDKALEKSAGVVRCAAAAGGRLVLAPTGPLTEYDDVRSVYEAALAGVRRAGEAGARRPLLALPAPLPKWPRAQLVALLGALEALYVPLQVRESFPEQANAPEALGVWAPPSAALAPGALGELLREAAALERARGLARDIGGADPERMTPLRCAALLRDAFPPEGAGGAGGGEGGGARVAVRVLDDAAHIAREYPLFAAVSRAADSVPRHRGCIVFLEYEPEEYEQTVMLVGKGVTYDTGGCDIKTGGAMAGMSRDVCGAAAVAGFVRACQLLRGRVKAVAALALLRNSVGEEAYVADELLRSRRGLSVRVGNTDAEGRLAMADLLAELAARARAERAPHLYTVATLTGHAARAVGEGYGVVLDNHAARAAGHAARLRAAGEALAEPLEESSLRREDLRAHRGRAPGDRLLQAEVRPSTETPRGHQAPAAFLLLAGGLHEGGARYSHLDVAGSAGTFPRPPTAAPLLALAAHYGLLRSC